MIPRRGLCFALLALDAELDVNYRNEKTKKRVKPLAQELEAEMFMQLQELSRLVTSSRGTPSREPSFEYSAAAELLLEGVGLARILLNFEPTMEISCRH